MAVSITISIDQNSQSIANNTSNVTVTVRASWTYGSYNLLEKSGWLTIDGTKYTFTSPFNTGRTTSGTAVLFTKTVDIVHSSNGTKTLAASASYTSGVSSGIVAASASKTLSTIPRLSSLSVSNGTLGAAQTLTITKQASSFTHTITYTCGTASGTVCTKSSSTSISWTPPLSLASQNTTGTTVSVTFTTATYNGDSSIGSNTKTITCTIPASVKPSCVISVTDATGYATTYGNPLKGLSKFKIVVTPTTSYGSAIVSYSVKVGGTTYTAASFTTGVITSSGDISISATVKDKRGRTGSETTTQTVLNYIEPTVARLTVRRCDEDGTDDDQGEFVQAVFTASVTSLNEKNAANYTLKYKKSTESTYTEVGLDDYTNIYAVTDATYIFQADTGSSYDLEVDVSDNFNTTKRATSASTAFTLLHWNADGTGLAVGKVSEEANLFDVGLASRFNKPVYGKVLGMDKLPEIPANADLNDYMEPGCYAIYRNDNAATIGNVPVARAGRLEVWSATGEGIRLEQWSYIRQRFVPYNRENPVWEREITRSADNVWRYYDWVRTSLTPTVSDRVYHEQKFLWGGDLTSGMYMTAGHTINLTEAVSAQPNGIILVFSAYNGTDDTNYAWESFFVPKILVAASNSGHTFVLGRGKFTYTGTKYLYIKDTSITGHDDNNLTGTSNGITYANNKFVLRYVIGV